MAPVPRFSCMRPTTGSIASLLAAAMLTACGAIPAGSVRDGRVHIVATMGPTCPVEKAGQPPCVAPYVGKLEILDPQGRRVEVTTTAAGTADVTLAPGVYSITAPRIGVLPRIAQPVSVTVTAGSIVTADVDFDTGIR